MFEIGETIVCIDCDRTVENFGLTPLKHYKVIEFKGKPFDPKLMVHIINDRNESQNYKVRRFITLTEYRKLKIKKIKNKI